MMRKHLHFICPTDGLETVINDTFNHKNYFITSLGNSMSFNADELKSINSLIELKGINEISFILSDDNRIILDALKRQNIPKINSLHHLHHQIQKYKEHTADTWQTTDLKSTIFSYYLTAKVDEFIPQLENWRISDLQINAKIYKRSQKIFSDISTDLIFNQHLILN